MEKARPPGVGVGGPEPRPGPGEGGGPPPEGGGGAGGAEAPPGGDEQESAYCGLCLWVCRYGRASVYPMALGWRFRTGWRLAVLGLFILLCGTDGVAGRGGLVYIRY